MTSFLGAGIALAGSSQFGIGTPASTSESAQNLFVKANGERGNANYIDPATGDYVYSNGYPVGDNSIAQRVYLALMTVQGSAADTTLGLPQHMLTINPASLESYRLAAVNALKPMVDANLIIVDSLTVIQVSNLNRLSFRCIWRLPNIQTSYQTNT